MVASRPVELMILRHAEAGQQPAAGADAERALTPRGRANATAQGAWLMSKGFAPDSILASPALRAAQTTQLVVTALSGPPSPVSWDQTLYLAPLPRLLTILGEVSPDVRQLLLVGHNPGLHALVEHLSGQPLSMGGWGRAFPTASLAHLRLPLGFQCLERGCGELAQLQPVCQGDEG